MNAVAGVAADSDTPLRAVFKISLNGQTVSIGTVGQAYRFITNLSSIEWIEFRALHADAVRALQSAADNAMLTRAGDRRLAGAVRPREAVVKAQGSAANSSYIGSTGTNCLVSREKCSRKRPHGRKLRRDRRRSPDP